MLWSHRQAWHWSPIGPLSMWLFYLKEMTSLTYKLYKGGKQNKNEELDMLELPALRSRGRRIAVNLGQVYATY